MHDEMCPTGGGVEPFDVFVVFIAVFATDAGGVVFGGEDFEAGAEMVVSRLFGACGSDG